MVEVTLLGVAQDGARPQAGCIQPCCSGLTAEDTMYPVSLGALEYSQGATDVEYLTVSADFAYQIYEIKTL